VQVTLVQFTMRIVGAAADRPVLVSHER
jgi:hypothetical protein